MSEWQPIETAPKDHRTILGFGTERIYSPARPHVYSMMWLFGDWTDPHESEAKYNPTHWMPLPAPPITATASDQ